MTDHLEIKITADNSYTLLNKNIDEHYHSHHGALQESLYVFIHQGLNKTNTTNIKVFEMGFGTGLNALLTALHAAPKKVTYDCVETHALPQQIVEQLMHTDSLKNNKELFLQLHTCSWNNSHKLSETVEFCKYMQNIQDITLNNNYYDLMYYDAFSPRKQPELWGNSCLSKCYNALKKDGIFVTYCAKSSVRKELQAVGFTVEKLPGPPGKREMLRAIK